MKNSTGSTGVFVQLVWRHKIFDLHQGLYLLYNSIFDYIRAGVHTSVECIRLTTSWLIRSVQEWNCLRRVHSVQQYIRLPQSWRARRALAAIFATSGAAAIFDLGGCETEAKSLAH